MSVAPQLEALLNLARYGEFGEAGRDYTRLGEVDDSDVATGLTDDEVVGV